MTDEPAFPGLTNIGITKRELIAAIVLAGLEANPELDLQLDVGVSLALARADELLRQTEAKNG